MNKQRPKALEREAAYKRDSKLVREVLSGDSSAFAELMSLYKKRVESLGMSFFKNAADAEDFAQDVFLKAYTKLDSFRGYVSIADENLLPDNGLTPEEKELRLLTMETVRESLKELPEKYKIVLDLYFFYDNSYAEISEITALAENTVKSHIFRAKKLLRNKIIEKGLVENE